jgi:hypothetical protein
MVILLVTIDVYSIVGYCWVLMVIDGYYIVGYRWLFYCRPLMVILLFVIHGYSINGY